MADELDKRLVEDIGVRYARMIEGSVRVMEVVDRTHEIPRDPKTGALVRPPGIPEAEWNLHQDAMKPIKLMPFYLRAHEARVSLAHRIAGDRAAAPQQIARYVVRALESTKREYPVLDVQAKEK